MDFGEDEDGLWWQDIDHASRQTERLTVDSTGSTRLITGKLRKSKNNKKSKNRFTKKTGETRKKKNEKPSPILPVSLSSTFPVGFFNAEKGIGCQLFESHIRVFLSVRDVGACAMTCRALSKLCPTYTVPELLKGQRLENHQLPPPKQRMTLCALVMRLVTTYHLEQDRPTRFVTPEEPEYDLLTRLVHPKCHTEISQCKAYHPEELPKVQLLMKEFLLGFQNNKVDNDSQVMSRWSSSALVSYCLRTFYPDGVPTLDSMEHEDIYWEFWFDQHDSETLSKNWVLVAAFLDDMNEILHGSAYNVTHIIRMLIQYNTIPYHDTFTDDLFLESGAKEERLVLTPAPHVRYQWWYTRLMGDARPRVTKNLAIFARDADSGKVRPFYMSEDSEINFPLRAGGDDELHHDKTEK